jgi:YHS domain-containing protein
LPHFSIRPAEGANLKLLAFLFALAVPFLGGDGAKASGTMPIARVGLTEQVVIDRVSGLAIAGYDPVAYFATGRPVRGSEAYEADYQGATWRFANEGNLRAFLDDPAVYMPRFGGYDAMAVANGIATPGDPRLFLISRDRLLLFRSAESLQEFVSAPDRLTISEGTWPRIAEGLVR